MTATPDSPQRANRERRGTNLFLQIRLAAAFLTILPVTSADPANDAEVSASFAWFPLIGALIGGLLCIQDRLLAYVVANTIRSVLLILFLATISGAVHLDGLADTADALGAGRDRACALIILRDSTIGTFGAVALFFALALKIVALASLSGLPRYAALFFAPVLSRWSMVAVGWNLPYLREAGAGSTLLTGDIRRNATIASASLIICGTAAILISPRVLAALIGGVAVSISIRRFYRWWLGGVTGDLIGACGELTEALAFLIIAA